MGIDDGFDEAKEIYLFPSFSPCSTHKQLGYKHVSQVATVAAIGRSTL